MSDLSNQFGNTTSINDPAQMKSILAASPTIYSSDGTSSANPSYAGATMPASNTTPTQTTQTSNTNTPSAVLGQSTTGQTDSSGNQIYPADPNGVSTDSYLSLMTNINNSLQQNNSLVDQKNAIQKQLFDQPLTQAELSKLPPDVAAVITSGNQDQMKLQLQIINDSLQGRNDSVSKSIGALTTGYNENQKNIQSALSNLMTYSVNKGVSLEELVKAYAPILGNDLAKQLGNNLSSVTDLYNKTSLTASTTGAESYGINIPAGTLAATNNNPGNLRFTGQDGATQGTGGFAKFSSPEAGYQALINDLTSKMTGQSGLTIPDGTNAGQTLSGSSTIEDLIRVYAPSSDNNDPTSYAQKIADTLGLTSDTQLSNVSPSDLASAMAQVESGTITYDKKDISSIVSNISGADDNKSQTPFGGLSLNALVNASSLYLNDLGKMPSLGLGGATDVKAARLSVMNYAGYVADKMGINVAQLSALYKAKTTAVSQNIQRLSKVDSITNSVANQLPRLATLADQLKTEGINVTESDLQSFAASGLNKFGSTTAAAYMELVNTIRADYSSSNAALAGSRGGEFFARAAVDAIPTGLTGAQYNTIKDTIVTSTANVSDGINKTTNEMITSIGSGSTDSGIGASSSSSSSTSNTSNDPLGIL
jgi:hypothetical protein